MHVLNIYILHTACIIILCFKINSVIFELNVLLVSKINIPFLSTRLMSCCRIWFYKFSESHKIIIIRDAGFTSVTQQRI